MRRLMLAILVCLMLAPSLALAADVRLGDPQPALAWVVNLLIYAAKAALAVLVPWGVHKLCVWVDAKTKTHLATDYEAKLDALLDQAIAYADEQARKYLAEHGSKMAGSAKLEAALAYVTGMADKLGLGGWAADQIKRLLEAKLGVDATRPVSVLGL